VAEASSACRRLRVGVDDALVRGAAAGVRVQAARKVAVDSAKNGAWRSLVAHLLWEQGVAGSNPAAPIEGTACKRACFSR
jgi:hypothetical protein